MRERLQQLTQAWRVTREHDEKLVLWVVGAGVVTLIFFGAAASVFSAWWWLIFGVILAPVVMLLVFGRRVQTTSFAQLEGQPGAAAAVLNQMRGQWFLTPVVAFNKKQDMVHRVVGRCGVVLVGEGARAGVQTLLRQEVKRMGRIASDVKVHTVVVGDGEGEVELDKLQIHLARLPGDISKTEVPKLDRKLKPLDKGLPIPQGYIPNPGKKMR